LHCPVGIKNILKLLVPKGLPLQFPFGTVPAYSRVSKQDRLSSLPGKEFPMQLTEPIAERRETKRTNMQTVVETLAFGPTANENLDEVAHDARNMITTLGLYCDLLEEPGVLNAPYAHYGSELRLVAAASRRLVQKLVALDANRLPQNPVDLPAARPMASQTPWSGTTAPGTTGHPLWELLPSGPIQNLADELAANRNLLSALAGPSIALSVTAEGAKRSVDLTGEDLTRILVNLVRNAVDVIPSRGRIDLTLREEHSSTDNRVWLHLAVTDDGPGIPAELVDKVFESGYSTHKAGSSEGWAGAHRGLGLTITRSIVEAAGGRIRAVSGAGAGARFEIELPARAC
jgi:signal transduction histidine kinase